VTIKDFAILARDAFSTDELAMGYFSIYKVNLDKLDMIEGKGRDRRGARTRFEEICSNRSPFEFSQQSAIYIWPEQSFKHKSPENLPRVMAAERSSCSGGDNNSNSSRSSQASKNCKL
jgi:hypothetical protein